MASGFAWVGCGKHGGGQEVEDSLRKGLSGDQREGGQWPLRKGQAECNHQDIVYLPKFL